MAGLKSDSVRALELLKHFRSKLVDNSEKSLKTSLDKLINVLSSDLFESLLDIREYYTQLLTQNCLSDTDPSVTVDNLIGNELQRNEPSEIESVNLNDNLSGLEESEWEYLEVIVSRPVNSKQGFGFSIAGGYDAPQENGDPSVFITRLAAGGIAELDKRLRPFDQIISVNGTDLTCVSNEEAINILRDSGDSLAMVIRRYIGAESISEIAKRNEELQDDVDTLDEGIWYEVDLVKPTPTSGLGFSIAGGHEDVDGTIGQIIIVKSITPGGLAESDGRIQPGDNLMQVNGIDLAEVTHSAAVDILRNTQSRVHLVLYRTPLSNRGSPILNSMQNPSSSSSITVAPQSQVQPQLTSTRPSGRYKKR